MTRNKIIRLIALVVGLSVGAWLSIQDFQTFLGEDKGIEYFQRNPVMILMCLTIGIVLGMIFHLILERKKKYKQGVGIGSEHTGAMKTGLSIIFLTHLLGGCATDFTEIKKTELNQAFILNSSPTFQGYHYLGSDESFHYFLSKWKYGRDSRFKINKNDMSVLKAEPYGHTEIRLYEFKPEGIEMELFCRTKNIELYRK